MKLTAALCVLTVLIGAVSSETTAVTHGGASNANSTVQECKKPKGWSAIAARKARYVIFGEIHGTREAPAFVGSVACALVTQGEHILVAVEHSATNNDAFQVAWALPDSQFSTAIRKKGWAGRKDGVASKAMLALLVRLHSLKEQGNSIDIVAFNGARDDAQRARFSDLPGQGPHEAAQAENIRVAANARNYDHVLVLVGELHAREAPVEGNNIRYKPMTMQLAPPSKIVSLRMISSAGTMWNCLLKPNVKIEPGKPIPTEAIECGNHPHHSRFHFNEPPFIGLGAPEGFEEDWNYDGFFWLGPISGSSPAVPAR